MSKFFINRPIVAMVISIIMVIVGLVTMVSLPIAQFPKVVPPEIFIQADYVGADAQTIEQSVATPIEQQMSGVDNMNYMYSVNANNGLCACLSTSIWLRTRILTRSDPIALCPGGTSVARRCAQFRRHGPKIPFRAIHDSLA